VWYIREGLYAINTQWIQPRLAPTDFECYPELTLSGSWSPWLASCHWEDWKCERNSKASELASKAELTEASFLPLCEGRISKKPVSLTQSVFLPSCKGGKSPLSFITFECKQGHLCVTSEGLRASVKGSACSQEEKCDRQLYHCSPEKCCLFFRRTPLFRGLTQHTRLFSISTAMGLLC